MDEDGVTQMINIRQIPHLLTRSFCMPSGPLIEQWDDMVSQQLSTRNPKRQRQASSSREGVSQDSIPQTPQRSVSDVMGYGSMNIDWQAESSPQENAGASQGNVPRIVMQEASESGRAMALPQAPRLTHTNLKVLKTLANKSFQEQVTSLRDMEPHRILQQGLLQLACIQRQESSLAQLRSSVN